MKRYIYIISLFALLSSTLSSCTDWLSTKPESEIIKEEFWRSESDVQAVVAACYKGLAEENTVLRMILWGELRSDNLWRGLLDINNDLGIDIYRVMTGEINAYNSLTSWGSFYSVINYCNTILENAPAVVEIDKNFTESDLLRTQAEVRALRALSYFYLVRAFKEVPWIEDASISDSQDFDQPKATEEVLIKNIIADLQFAQRYAPRDYGKESHNKGRVTQNMVNALLADVYLWNEDYEACIAACDLVLSDTGLKLVNADLAHNQIFYRGNSTESIFELQFDDVNLFNNAVKRLYGGYGTVGYFAFPNSLSYAPYQTDNNTGVYSPFNYRLSTTDVEGQDDIRAKDSYDSSTSTYYIFKYSGAVRTEDITKTKSNYTYRSNTANWIIYRLSDVMLMKAEALVELNSDAPDASVNEANYQAALDLVNTVYKRSNPEAAALTLSNYPTLYDKRNMVLRERQRELLFEGKRWFDLLRMARREGNTSTINDYMDRKSSGATASLGVPSMDALYWPINDGELKANPALVQNPYYKVNSSSNR